MQTAWDTHYSAPSVVHSVPREDLIDHDETFICICHPLLWSQVTDMGNVGWVVTHNSLDGRENSE